jgi:hypothetical protein
MLLVFLPTFILPTLPLNVNMKIEAVPKSTRKRQPYQSPPSRPTEGLQVVQPLSSKPVQDQAGLEVKPTDNAQPDTLGSDKSRVYPTSSRISWTSKTIHVGRRRHPTPLDQEADMVSLKAMESRTTMQSRKGLES